MNVRSITKQIVEQGSIQTDLEGMYFYTEGESKSSSSGIKYESKKKSNQEIEDDKRQEQLKKFYSYEM